MSNTTKKLLLDSFQYLFLNFKLFQGISLCEGDEIVVNTFDWPVKAKCEKEGILLDQTYSGISLNEKNKATYVISSPRVYKLNQNSLEDVTDDTESDVL